MSQHYRPVNSQNEGIALAHTLYGQPVTATAPPNAGLPNIQPAFGGWSTAPYVRRAKDNPSKPLCSEEGCKAYPTKTTPYCTGHARKHGLLPSAKEVVAQKAAANGDVGRSEEQGPQPDGDPDLGD